MTAPNVLQLIKKYADPIQPTGVLGDGLYQNQQNQLSEFAHHFQTKFGVILAEMEHDIGILRERKFDKNAEKHFTQIWMHLMQIRQEIKEDKPYEAANQLIQYVKSPQTETIIEELNFKIQAFLKETNVDFIPLPVFKHPEVKSLKLLASFADFLEKYIAENPLIKEHQSTPATRKSTWRPPPAAE